MVPAIRQVGRSGKRGKGAKIERMEGRDGERVGVCEGGEAGEGG